MLVGIRCSVGMYFVQYCERAGKVALDSFWNNVLEISYLFLSSIDIIFMTKMTKREKNHFISLITK